MMDEYCMPDHIKAHSFKARDVSVFLAKELNNKGEDLNINLVEASALLHDIAKILCLGSKERHDLVGAKILREKGYDRIAEIIEQHILLVEKHSQITEEEIVFYADKRVMHDKIVSLSKRFKDVTERYAFGNIDMIKKKSYELEKRIFKNLDFKPDDLTELLK